MKTPAALFLAASCLLTLPVSAESPATKPQLKFGEQTFSLEFTGGSAATGTVNEYIPEGETLQRWTKMIAVRTQPTGNDPGKAVGALVNALKTKNPQAKFAVWKSNDGKKVGVDFITWEGDIVEFNVFIYGPAASGTGLISHQYAERAYGEDMIPFMKGMKDRRNKLLDQAINFDYPMPVEKEGEG